MALLWTCVCLTIAELLVFGHGADLAGKAMLFPEEGDTSYAVIYPIEPLEMREFTLCLRVSTEITGEREMILFSYFKDGDELNLWREKDGQLSLYIRGSEYAVKFSLPPLNILETHLCVTWKSSSGITTFWYNGKRSMSKVYRKGLQILPGGSVILGQDQDKAGSGFDAKQSLVGQISDVHLWNYVLSPGDIKYVYEDTPTYSGNIINWQSINFTPYGKVIIRD